MLRYGASETAGGVDATMPPWPNCDVPAIAAPPFDVGQSLAWRQILTVVTGALLFAGGGLFLLVGVSATRATDSLCRDLVATLRAGFESHAVIFSSEPEAPLPEPGAVTDGRGTSKEAVVSAPPTPLF